MRFWRLAQRCRRRLSGRRRIIYVISDGKEYGSKAKFGDVMKYLQTNQISVWATLVGDSSVPGMGFVDRMHLPLMMRDNILPAVCQRDGRTDECGVPDTDDRDELREDHRRGADEVHGGLLHA